MILEGRVSGAGGLRAILRGNPRGGGLFGGGGQWGAGVSVGLGGA